MSDSGPLPEQRVEVTPTNPLHYGESLLPKAADGLNDGPVLKLHKDDEFDGELRLYLANKFVWSPDTGSQKAHTLHLLEDGSLCIHNEGGEIIWTNGRTHSLYELPTPEDPKLRLVLAATAGRQPMQVLYGTNMAYDGPDYPIEIKTATFKAANTKSHSWAVIRLFEKSPLWHGLPLNAGDTEIVSWDDAQTGETWNRKPTTLLIGMNNVDIHEKTGPLLKKNFKFTEKGKHYTFTLTERSDGFHLDRSP